LLIFPFFIRIWFGLRYLRYIYLALFERMKNVLKIVLLMFVAGMLVTGCASSKRGACPCKGLTGY
jgi:hypothetical protein